MDYLLDTNILIAYLRNNDLTQRLENDLDLLNPANTLIISVVSIGEMKSIAIKNRWGQKKQRNLILSLNDFLISDINVSSVINRYAEIDAFSQNRLPGKTLGQSARNMGKNDLWIAAAASVYELPLVTTDKDFSHLNPEFLNLKLVNLDDYKK